MKKALPVVLVLAAMAAALLVFFRRAPSTPESIAARLAELAPADSLALLEFPDLERTTKRTAALSFQQIAQEPEWKEFAANLDSFLAANLPDKGVFELIQFIKEAEPISAFVALSGQPSSNPTVTGGFAYRGKRTSVKSAIEKFRTLSLGSRITDKFAVVSESKLVTFEGTEIEVRTGQGFSMVTAYRDNWFFFANDLEAMQSLLQRYTATPGAKPGLAQDPLYTALLKQQLAEPEVGVFIRAGTILESIVGRPGDLGPLAKLKLDGLGYSLKFDGLLMRDRLYFRGPKVPQGKPLANRPLTFTSEQTYVYAASNGEGWEDLYREALELWEKSPGAKSDVDALAAKGVKYSEIPAVFGPEWSIHSDWETGGLAVPTLFASLEVRDPVKARGFAEFIVDELKKNGKLSEKEEEGTKYWTLSFDIPIIQPTLALNAKHLLFGLNYATVRDGLKQRQSTGAKLGQAPAFQGALRTVTTPTLGMFYLDLKILFERLYEKFKPALAFQITGNPEMAKYFDVAKLPRAETISKHLQPAVIVYGNAPEGFMIDSSGTLSLYPLVVPAVGGVFVFRAAPMPARPPVSAAPAVRAAPSPAPAPNTPPEPLK